MLEREVLKDMGALDDFKVKKEPNLQQELGGSKHHHGKEESLGGLPSWANTAMFQHFHADVEKEIQARDEKVLEMLTNPMRKKQDQVVQGMAAASNTGTITGLTQVQKNKVIDSHSVATKGSESSVVKMKKVTEEEEEEEVEVEEEVEASLDEEEQFKKTMGLATTDATTDATTKDKEMEEKKEEEVVVVEGADVHIEIA